MQLELLNLLVWSCFHPLLPVKPELAPLQLVDEEEWAGFDMDRNKLKRIREQLSRPDSRSDPNGGSEPGSGRETIYWDSLPVYFFFPQS